MFLTLLFFHYFTIILVIFELLALLQNKTKLIFRLVFIAEIWPFAVSITGISVLSNQQQNRLNRGAPTCPLPRQGRPLPRHRQGNFDGCKKAIQNAVQDETYHSRHQLTAQ